MWHVNPTNETTFYKYIYMYIYLCIRYIIMFFFILSMPHCTCNTISCFCIKFQLFDIRSAVLQLSSVYLSSISLPCAVSSSIYSLHSPFNVLFIFLLYRINFGRFTILTKHCPIILQYQLRQIHEHHKTLVYLSLYYIINFVIYSKLTSTVLIITLFIVNDRNQQVR